MEELWARFFLHMRSAVCEYSYLIHNLLGSMELSQRFTTLTRLGLSQAGSRSHRNLSGLWGRGEEGMFYSSILIMPLFTCLRDP